jgi:hypothetical protein
MPVYLDTSKNSVVAIGICDRCSRKFPYVDLMPDPNFPGMRVCREDLDDFDPWRLPALQTENIALRFPRPDTSIALTPAEITLPGSFTEAQNSIFIQGVPPNSGASGDLSYANNSPYSPQSLRPAIGSISPNTGTAAGGTMVLINGGNFTDLTTVKFAGSPATFELISSIQVSVITPPGRAGLADVTVISPFGTYTEYGGFTYT